MGKLLILSNRLPVSVKRGKNGELEYYPSIGGLATGLASYTTSGKGLWIGWPGIPSDELSEADKSNIIAELKKHNCVPVFLSKKMLDDFYNGYSNSVLWPLFHNLPIDESKLGTWEAYHRANKLFAEAVLGLSGQNSTIWVHDYQLLLAPEMIRVHRPKAKIGFFLHIPFPNPETFFTQKQHATKLLRGVLGAGLIGLHTVSYVDNFLECCRQANVGVVGRKQVALSVRVVRVAEFPMGINYDKFSSATKERAVTAEYNKLRVKYIGKKVILTIDRLDPTKGLVERLRAYQTLLRDNRQLRGKVVMVMLAMPSRTEVEAYIKLRQQVEKLVRDINKTYGTLFWTPVEYMFQTMPFQEFAALYRRADVAFIAPIRDGMNLVAKEYLASKPKKDGVLVLSETAGAAEELKDAIIVNPSRPKTLVEGLNKALTMKPSELKQRMGKMQRHLQYHTVDFWAESFVNTLSNPTAISPIRTKTLQGNQLDQLISDYKNAKKRLLIFDYDGVLTPFSRKPQEAMPSQEVLDLLKKLSNNPKNEVVIISGRDKVDLSEWFGNLPIALAAEHGALFRRADGRNWYKTSQIDKTWRKKVDAIMRYFAIDTPGVIIEQKESSLAWHYRRASPFASQKNLVGLRRLLKPIAKSYGLTIKEGHKVIEVLPGDVSKAKIVEQWLIHDHDFVLTMGDDVTDEDMFMATPPGGYSIKIGKGRTEAKYRLHGVSDALGLIARLSSARR